MAAAGVVVVSGIYFAVPLGHADLSGGRMVVRTAGLVAGLGMLAWLIAAQARRALRHDGYLAERLGFLVTLVMIVAAFFAAWYYVLAGQFRGIHTRLDALYFSATTLTTVGYGDITPFSQAARALTIVQMLFDLIIVASTITITVGALRSPRPVSGRIGGMDAVAGCLACDLLAGVRPLPGGRLAEEAGWVVEHSVGALGLGTLVVKPVRHVVHVAELDDRESAALGPLLRRVAAAVTEVVRPEQVYVCLWSHAGGVPAHVHFVVQPVVKADMERFGALGPDLQTAMFREGALPGEAEVEEVCGRFRAVLSRG